ncbi:hypothetical protein RUND412_007444 [Rhizina undulata]
MSEKRISFKKRIQASPFIGKPIEVGDFFWGDGVTLHSNNQMKRHLGFENGKAKNRKRRCFYSLQIISETLVLACTTTTRNSSVWKDMPEEFYKYFLPIHQTAEVRGRRAITVYNDWEGAFNPGKSLLYLEYIKVIPRKYLYRAFIRLSLDLKGFIILPEANASRIRHSSKFQIGKFTHESKLALADTPPAPATKNYHEATPTKTTAEEKPISGPPQTMTSQRPRKINVLTPGSGAATSPSSPPNSPTSNSGYESNVVFWRSGSRSMSRQAPRSALESSWRRRNLNATASPISDEDGFQLVERTRKSRRTF